MSDAPERIWIDHTITPYRLSGNDLYPTEYHRADIADAELTSLRAVVTDIAAERDSFRAVLEAAQYREIDTIATNTVEQSRALGEAVMQATLAANARTVNAVAAYCELLDRAKTLEDALTLAANRLQALTVDFTPGSRAFIEASEWAAEARATLKGGAA
jgi:hypothetical protein